MIIKIEFKIEITLTYSLRTDGLLEETNVHASKTDTFTIGNSLRVHTSSLPKLERLPRKSAGVDQSHENSTRCTRTYAFFFAAKIWIYRGMGGCQPINESSTCARVCVAAKVWTVYFGMARMPVPDEYTWWHNLLSWRDGEPLSFVIRLKLGVGLKQRLDFDCGVKGHTVAPPLPLPSLPS